MLKNFVFPYTFHIETICNSSMTSEFLNRINLCSNTQVVSGGCSLLKHIYVCVFYILYLYILYLYIYILYVYSIFIFIFYIYIFIYSIFIYF
jgi:hypothetical protein